MERLNLVRDWLEWAEDHPSDPPAVLLQVMPPTLDALAMLDHFGALDADTAAAARAALDAWRAEQDARWQEQLAAITGADSDRRLIDEATRVAALLESRT